MIEKIIEEIYQEAIKKKYCFTCKYYHNVSALPTSHGQCNKDNCGMDWQNPKGVCPDWELKGELIKLR